MMTERFNFFITSIYKIHRNIQRIKNRKMTQLNLKGIHVMCLFQLRHNPEGLTITQLANECCEDKAAISRIISHLSDIRLVTLEGEQKYRTPYRLTEEGNDIADTIDNIICSTFADCSKGITEEERVVLHKCLTTISDNLEEYYKTEI